MKIRNVISSVAGKVREFYYVYSRRATRDLLKRIGQKEERLRNWVSNLENQQPTDTPISKSSLDLRQIIGPPIVYHGGK